MCFAIARAAGKGPENKPSLEVFVEDESGNEESGSDKSDSGPPLCFSPPPSSFHCVCSYICAYALSRAILHPFIRSAHVSCRGADEVHT